MCLWGGWVANYDLDIDWHLTDKCGFQCEYCHPNIARFKNRPLPYNLSTEEVARAFTGLGRIPHVSMSGGEPFDYPNFVYLCQLLTEGGYISMNTNLASPDVRNFAERIDPLRVIDINAATHILERERQGLPISDFIEKMLLLQDRGFKPTVFYVLYPPLLERFERDLDHLIENGVQRVAGKVFKGVYQGRRYPESYTTEERERITGYERNVYPVLFNYLAGQHTEFKGRLCDAGRKSLKVEVDGTAKRCTSIKGDHGNLFDGTLRLNEEPEQCTARRVLSISWCLRNIVEDNQDE